MPAELLTSRRAVEELNRDPARVMQAIGQAAKQQAKVFGGEAKDRKAKLSSIADEFVRKIEQHSDRTVAFDPGSYSDKARDILVAETDETEARLRLLASLAGYLSTAPSWGSKAERLMGLLEAGGDPQTDAPVEELLGEILLSDAAVADVFYEVEDGNHLIEDLLSILTGAAAARPDAPSVIKRIHALCRDRELPGVLHGLKRAIMGRLSNAEPLLPAKESDPNHINRRLSELTALARLSRRFKAAGGWFNSKQMQDLIELRVSRITGENDLADFVQEQPVLALKIEIILKHFPNVVGKANRNRVASYLQQIIMAPDFADRLARDFKEPIEKLALPGLIERKIRLVHLPKEAESRLLARLSAIQEAYIRQYQVFRRINSLRADDAEKGAYVLELIAQGAFTSGKCREAAKRMVYRMLPDPSLLVTVVAKIEDPEERAEKLEYLQDHYHAL